MIKTFLLYIGANNQTKKVERAKLLTELDKDFEGYTVQPAMGCWRGQREDSVVVTVTADETMLTEVVNRLKYVLKQDAIAYQEAPELHFI